MKLGIVVLALVMTLSYSVNAEREDELVRYLTRIIYKGLEVSFIIIFWSPEIAKKLKDSEKKTFIIVDLKAIRDNVLFRLTNKYIHQK